MIDILQSKPKRSIKVFLFELNFVWFLSISRQWKRVLEWNAFLSSHKMNIRFKVLCPFFLIGDISLVKKATANFRPLIFSNIMFETASYNCVSNKSGVSHIYSEYARLLHVLVLQLYNRNSVVVFAYSYFRGLFCTRRICISFLRSRNICSNIFQWHRYIKNCFFSIARHKISDEYWMNCISTHIWGRQCRRHNTRLLHLQFCTLLNWAKFEQRKVELQTHTRWKLAKFHENVFSATLHSIRYCETDNYWNKDCKRSKWFVSFCINFLIWNFP